MKITIHRGTHQIGGSCVEISTDTTRIILDVGLPLNDGEETKSPKRLRSKQPLPDGLAPQVDGLFSSGRKIDAIFLSHVHSDHGGLLAHTEASIPIHCTQGTSKMMMAASIYAGQTEVPRTRIKTLKPKVPVMVGDIQVTAYPVDHSAFDGVALLVEANGTRALYSGDLRMHGRKPGMAQQLIQAVAAKGVDALIMEGTHFSGSRAPGRAEKELEEDIVDDIQSASGLVLASFSPMHVDRLVTFYKAARRCNRILAVDHYAAFVLHLIASQARIPKPQAENRIRVFLPKAQRKLPKIDRLFAHSHITLAEILANPRDYVMLFRSSMVGTDFSGQLPERVRCIYSYWSGYLKQPEWEATRAKVKEVGGDFQVRHSSGHIHAPDIVRFVEAIKPRLVIPIHTTNPEEFAKHLQNVKILEDKQGFGIE
ncbi:MAG: MBL fold metallo-hydrolase [Verrucomicrobiota bacterium]